MKTNPFLKTKLLQYMGFTFVLLILVLLISLAQFASFALIQQHLISYYGVESEDISMSFLAMYAGIVTFLPIQFRFLRYFTMRNYLVIALLSGILLNFGSFATHDIVVFIVLRFFQGLAVASSAGCMLIVIFSILPGEKGSIIGTSIFFAAILTTGSIIGVLSSWIVLNMDYKFLYYILILLQAIALLICYLIFQPQRQERKYPLYQMDWVACLFFAVFSISLSYVMIYGPKQYWFSSPSIVTFSIIAFLMLVLFLYRQATTKRPHIHLKAFKYGKFIIGLILLIFFYGIKDTINLVYGYAGGILGWSSADVVQLGLYNSAGVVISIFLAVRIIFLNKLNTPKLIIVGFLIMIFYNLWMYYSLTSNMSFVNLAIPVFIHGIASGLIFLPVMIFTMSAIPKITGFTGIIICAYARFITSLNSISGFYMLQLNYNTQFKQSFLGHLTNQDANFIERNSNYKKLFLSKGFSADQANALSIAMINKATAIQGQLLTNRAIFMIASVSICVIIAVFIGFISYNKIIDFKNQKQSNLLF